MKTLVLVMVIMFSSLGMATEVVSMGAADFNSDGEMDIVRIVYFDQSSEKGFKKYKTVALMVEYSGGETVVVDSFVNDAEKKYKIYDMGDFNNDLNIDLVLTAPSVASKGNNIYYNLGRGKWKKEVDMHIFPMTPGDFAKIYVSAYRNRKIMHHPVHPIPEGFGLEGSAVIASQGQADFNLDGRMDYVDVRYRRTIPLNPGQKILSLTDLNEIEVVVQMSTFGDKGWYHKEIVIDRFENLSNQPFVVTSINDARVRMHFDIHIGRELDPALGETEVTEENFSRIYSAYENQLYPSTFVKTHDEHVIQVGQDYLVRNYENNYRTMTFKNF